MNKIILWVIGVVAVAALALSLVGDSNQSVLLGANGTRFPNGLSTGQASTSPTMINKVLEGAFTNTSCSGAATQAATTSTTYDCAVTGVLPGDRVWLTMGSSTPYGAYLSSAYASSTVAGSIRVVLGNASTSAVSATMTAAVYHISN